MALLFVGGSGAPEHDILVVFVGCCQKGIYIEKRKGRQNLDRPQRRSSWIVCLVCIHAK